MSILIFILVFIVVILLLGVSIVGAILRAAFGFGRRSSSRPNQARYEHSGQQQYQQNQHSQSTSDYEEATTANNAPKNKHKKIFAKDEGEYIDFEEIKE